MTPESVQAFLNARGRTVTLRRYTGTTVMIPLDVGVKAYIIDLDPAALAGTVIEGDRGAVIGNAEILAAQWPGPPRKDDKIVDGDKEFNIEVVNTKHIGERVARFDLRIRG